MRKLLITLTVVIALCLTTNVALAADPGSDSATCAVSVTVSQIIEWEGANFAAISLTPAITTQADAPTGNAVYTLWTNCNVQLSADNTATAELDNDGASSGTPVTEYKLATDANGVSGTGATSADVTSSSSDAWTGHATFLGTPLAVTHVDGDGAVEVTLEVKATNDSDNVVDAGAYSATQNITAAWTSD